ncbi:hypothetical protein UlMin_000620 [Ulmus minor]
MEAEEILQEELPNVEVEIHDVEEQIKMLLERQERLYERQSEIKALLEASKESGDHVKDNTSTTVENRSGAFEWDSEADDVRFNVFGISTCCANQRQIVNAVMSGRDVMVIMAAGGGKTLCYQLPAVLRNGVAVVISPLLSLIQDQVMGLAALGIPANMLTSTTSKEEEKFIYKALEKGEGDMKILYVTPEKISKSKRFICAIECFILWVTRQEVHCCSQWGHDSISQCSCHCSDSASSSLSLHSSIESNRYKYAFSLFILQLATATQKVQNDLMEMLHIPKYVKFVSTVNRPNLFYMVREKSSVGKVVIDEIAEFIQENYPYNESGIVYCFSRKECEQVAKELRERGISADFYHADMNVNAREKVHMQWSKNKLQVIVGMVAFGMGINKPDAGRDGLPSQCLLYFRPADAPRQSSMVFYENSGLQNLYDSSILSSIFRHFAEPLQDCNGMCDNCAFSSEAKEVDALCHAKLIVSLLQDVQDNDQRMTMLQLIDKTKTKHKELEEFQHTVYTTNAYVTTGPLAKQVLLGKRNVTLEICSGQKKVAGIKSVKNNLASSGMEIKLDELQKELSSTHGGIFMTSTQKPNSMEEEKIVGKLKTEKYGSRIL